MADNTSYHKLEPETNDLLDREDERGFWKGFERLHWREWLRICCEALLVVVLIGLVLKITMDDRTPGTGRNEPRKDCESLLLG